ncbi:MAG: class I SAM-dependent methyltransferase [Gaiellales bacterium]
MNQDAVAVRAALQRERATALAEKVAEWLAPLAGDEHVLDVGCGTGAFAFAIAGAVASVVGIDGDVASLDAARAAAPPNVELRHGDATALAFADASFDIAGCFRVLHHVTTPDRVVAELGRVTRHGGRLLLVDQLREPDPDAAAATERFERARDVSHARLLARAEIETTLREAGFEIHRTDLVRERRETERFLDLAGLTSERREAVRALAPADAYDVEVGWFLACRHRDTP